MDGVELTDDKMKIRGPDVLVDDSLTRDGEAFVLEQIEKFAGAVVELPNIHTELTRDQYKNYSQVLGAAWTLCRTIYCNDSILCYSSFHLLSCCSEDVLLSLGRHFFWSLSLLRGLRSAKQLRTPLLLLSLAVAGLRSGRGWQRSKIC